MSKEEIERLEKKIAFLQECMRREKEMDMEDLKRLQPELEQQAEQAFTEQEELDAIERPASQARVEQEANK